MHADQPRSHFVAKSGIGKRFLTRAMRGTNVTLDVSDGRLLVDEGRGGAFPLAGAMFGLWRMPGLGVVSGTVLHLDDGRRSYRVGGRDHRPAASLPLKAPTTGEADAYLPAMEFDALLELALASMPPVYHHYRRRWTSHAAGCSRIHGSCATG